MDTMDSMDPEEVKEDEMLLGRSIERYYNFVEQLLQHWMRKGRKNWMGISEHNVEEVGRIYRRQLGEVRLLIDQFYNLPVGGDGYGSEEF